MALPKNAFDNLGSTPMTPQEIGAATGQGTLTPIYGASGQVTGQNYNPAAVDPTLTGNTAITPASLAPTTPLVPTPVAPGTVVADPVLSTPTPSTTDQPLQQESDIYRMMQELQGSTNALGTKDSFIEQQRVKNDIIAKEGLQNAAKTRFDNLVVQGNSVADQIKQQNLLRYSGQGIQQGIVEGKGTTQTRQAQLDNAIAKQGAAADYAIASGDLATAMAHVDQAVKMEYDYKKGILDAKRADIELLLKDPSLTLAQAKRAEDLKRKYAQEDAALVTDAATKTAKHDAVLKAFAAFGTNPLFDSITQAAIKAATTDTEVAQILAHQGLSTVAAPKAETQLTKLDNGETVLVDTQTGKIISRLGGQKAPEAPTGSTNVVIDGKPTTVSNDALAYARIYASGKIPSPAELKLAGTSMGEVETIARGLPKPDGSIIDNNTGVKPTTLSAEQEKGITAMNEIVTKTMPALKDRFGKISTGLLGGIGGMIWTSQDRQDYDTFRQEFLSKLLVARSGAAVTEQEYARYAKMLPSNFNQLLFLGSDGSKKLNSLSTSMQTNLDNTLNANQVNVAGYSDMKNQLDQLSPEQLKELGDTLPAWYTPKTK